MLQSKPTVEVISCLDDAILLPTNHMANEFVPDYSWTMVLEAIISNEVECIAFIGVLSRRHLYMGAGWR